TVLVVDRLACGRARGRRGVDVVIAELQPDDAGAEVAELRDEAAHGTALAEHVQERRLRAAVLRRQRGREQRRDEPEQTLHPAGSLRSALARYGQRPCARRSARYSGSCGTARIFAIVARKSYSTRWNRTVSPSNDANVARGSPSRGWPTEPMLTITGSLPTRYVLSMSPGARNVPDFV